MLKYQAMKIYGDVVSFHALLTSAPDGSEWWASPLGRFISGTCWIAGRLALEGVWTKRRLTEPSVPQAGIKPRYLSRPIRNLVTVLTEPGGFCFLL
jgi:hypothetical protein